MISKEKFINYMQQFKKLENKEKELCKGFHKIATDFEEFHFTYHHRLILNLLKELMHDEMNAIYYFVRECEWGKKGENAVLNTDTQERYSLNTFEELYDFIELVNNTKE